MAGIREHRIEAGAIIIQSGRILLVRYRDSSGKSFLVGPGGGALSNEGIYQAVIREVREETGLEVSPHKVLFVEDLLSRRYRIVKIWLLCNLVSGQLANTQGALEEGITDVAWYRKDQLQNEVVYPPVLLSYDWEAFSQNNWESKYLELRETDF
jgi:8-oxo-dGTP pyrophosphatase MutT (NUDIX family)